MIKVIVGRLLQLIPVLGIIFNLTFFMSKVVPGGPFRADRQATPEVIA
jgi:oligopeptide transport system permease protein